MLPKACLCYCCKLTSRLNNESSLKINTSALSLGFDALIYSVVKWSTPNNPESYSSDMTTPGLNNGEKISTRTETPKKTNIIHNM